MWQKKQELQPLTNLEKRNSDKPNKQLKNSNHKTALLHHWVKVIFQKLLTCSQGQLFEGEDTGEELQSQNNVEQRDIYKSNKLTTAITVEPFQYNLCQIKQKDVQRLKVDNGIARSYLTVQVQQQYEGEYIAASQKNQKLLLYNHIIPITRSL